MTKQEIVDRCLSKVRAIGGETVILYAHETSYTLEEALMQDMTNEIELAYSTPIQFYEFPLSHQHDYFFVVSAAELCGFKTSTRMPSDSGDFNILASKLYSDRKLNDKIARIFKVIWSDALSIYEGRY